VTIGVSRLQPDMQPREICLANLERMGQAAVDLGTLDSFHPETVPSGLKVVRPKETA
ncbi:MAG: hypothetical protein QOD82_1187, partial [Pseudonocardiales bacterium]|nr:hypothetical protein [Pseudonocardiales bacterium]